VKLPNNRDRVLNHPRSTFDTHDVTVGSWMARRNEQSSPADIVLSFILWSDEWTVKSTNSQVSLTDVFLSIASAKLTRLDRIPECYFVYTKDVASVWWLGLEAVSRRSSASARSRLGVGTPRPRLGFELWRPWSRSRLGLNCQGLLDLGLGLQGLGLAPLSRLKRPRAHPWFTHSVMGLSILDLRVLVGLLIGHIALYRHLAIHYV